MVGWSQNLWYWGLGHLGEDDLDEWLFLDESVIIAWLPASLFMLDRYPYQATSTVALLFRSLPWIQFWHVLIHHRFHESSSATCGLWAACEPQKEEISQIQSHDTRYFTKEVPDFCIMLRNVCLQSCPRQKTHTKIALPQVPEVYIKDLSPHNLSFITYTIPFFCL